MPQWKDRKGENWTEVDLGKLAVPVVAKPEYQDRTAYLVVWFLRIGQGPERTSDVRIYSEPNPTAPSTMHGEAWRSCVIAQAQSRDYEGAVASIHEAVDKHWALRWVKATKRLAYWKDRVAADVKLTG